ncbi:MAG: NADH-quinone oxidoreductase subunit C [Dehalococcoidia bacterium]
MPPRAFDVASAIPRAEVPVLGMAAFRASVLDAVRSGQRLAALFAGPEQSERQLYAILADPDAHRLAAVSTIPGDRYPALTPDCPQAHWFEREIAESSGIEPAGHPWLKPLRFNGTGAVPGVTDYFRLGGRDAHEVAVGPVHAGIIEPGHFRFQAYGEEVLHLEISLGYQHRGVERALRGGPDLRSVSYAETLAGDTSIGHATAYAQNVEALAGIETPRRAEAVRALALELERLANHVGDLGMLSGDVGYLPTAAFCGRIRGEFLNLSATVCGSRFGRGLVRPGGTAFDVDAEMAADLLARLDRAEADARGAVSLLWESASVRSRFEGTGPLRADACLDLGIVGVAARAAGLPRDARADFPTGVYRRAPFIPATHRGGDVFARATVRAQEIEASCNLVRALLHGLQEEAAGPVLAAIGELAPDHLAVAMVEGWRGEICHVALTDERGRFAAYRIVDPSFHNWFGLAYAMRGQAISDFPLTNKSFNLSYCGHDL